MGWLLITDKQVPSSLRCSLWYTEIHKKAQTLGLARFLPNSSDGRYTMAVPLQNRNVFKM